MIGKRLFRKYFFVIGSILILFTILGFFANHLAMRFTRRPEPSPPMFVAKLIDLINPADRVKAIEEARKMDDHIGRLQLNIIDSSGRIIFPEGQQLPFDWKTVNPPQMAYEYRPIEPGEPRKHDGPPDALIRFRGEPAQYLYIAPGKEQGPPRPPFNMFLISMGSMVLSVLLGVGFALLLLFRSLQEKAKMADQVISELQHGNLKARFPIKKTDEYGQAMIRFNMMAEEIERLVEQLKNAEKSRMTLLQELAHDLRTPIASLKNLLETLATKGESLDKKIYDEFLALSLKEIDYFERLVEDLLTLAQVSEPRYNAEKSLVFLIDLLDEESESVAAKYASDEHNIYLTTSFPATDVQIPGDAHLLRRMFRNALENAFSFARTKVTLSLEVDANTGVTVLIEDDGPGFTKKALEAFGFRRMTRILGATHGGRLSVGLGSVIMKTVAEIHRGSVSACNRTSASNEILGASIRFFLPSILTTKTQQSE